MAAASFGAITEASFPAIFLALGHDLRRPRLEVVKGLLQLCDTLVEPGRCPQGGGATPMLSQGPKLTQRLGSSVSRPSMPPGLGIHREAAPRVT
jgi:hypothetical protein